MKTLKPQDLWHWQIEHRYYWGEREGQEGGWAMIRDQIKLIRFNCHIRFLTPPGQPVHNALKSPSLQHGAPTPFPPGCLVIYLCISHCAWHRTALSISPTCPDHNNRQCTRVQCLGWWLIRPGPDTDQTSDNNSGPVIAQICTYPADGQILCLFPMFEVHRKYSERGILSNSRTTSHSAQCARCNPDNLDF